MYIWCQLNKDTIVNFWFGTQFKAMYLPWVLFGFKLIISGGGVMELIGILIGHMYFFLMFKYPQVWLLILHFCTSTMYRVSHDTGHPKNWLSPRPFIKSGT